MASGWLTMQHLPHKSSITHISSMYCTAVLHENTQGVLSLWTNAQGPLNIHHMPLCFDVRCMVQTSSLEELNDEKVVCSFLNGIIVQYTSVMFPHHQLFYCLPFYLNKANVFECIIFVFPLMKLKSVYFEHQSVCFLLFFLLHISEGRSALQQLGVHPPWSLSCRRDENDSRVAGQSATETAVKRKKEIK